MISRPYKAYYVNAQGKDCGWFGQNCNPLEDLGNLVVGGAVPQATAPITKQTGSKKFLLTSGSGNAGVGPAAAGGSSVSGKNSVSVSGGKIGVGPALPASGTSTVTPQPVQEIMDEINEKAAEFGIPEGLGLPLLVGGSILLLILLVKR